MDITVAIPDGTERDLFELEQCFGNEGLHSSGPRSTMGGVGEALALGLGSAQAIRAAAKALEVFLLRRRTVVEVLDPNTDARVRIDTGLDAEEIVAILERLDHSQRDG